MAKVTVKATAVGQKPDRSWARIGDTFQVEEKQFSSRWMEKVTTGAKKPAGQPKAEGQ